jgi:hypothetical protein
MYQLVRLVDLSRSRRNSPYGCPKVATFGKIQRAHFVRRRTNTAVPQARDRGYNTTSLSRCAFDVAAPLRWGVVADSHGFSELRRNLQCPARRLTCPFLNPNFPCPPSPCLRAGSHDLTQPFVEISKSRTNVLDPVLPECKMSPGNAARRLCAFGVRLQELYNS